MSLSKIRRSDIKFGNVLGHGGFSTVYKAKWRRTLIKSENVAAKKIFKVQSNELEIMSKLDHENIVKLLGVVDESPEFYIILELCSRGSLRAYLSNRDGKRLPDDMFYPWAKQSAKPIEYLQNIGILHKDIKAENYVITEDFVLKLTDFGLARELAVTTQNASNSGTCGFMAPELMKDQILSPRYDIFSFGVLLWELFTTEIPFKDMLYHQIIWRVVRYNDHPPIPSDCPPAIASLMRQCWEVVRTNRPTMNQILQVISDAEKDVIRRAEKRHQLLHVPWELETKIAETIDECGPMISPCGITVNPATGDVAVADNAGKVEVYGSDGEHKFHLNAKQDLEPETPSLPAYIASSMDGLYYFLTDETQYVKYYSKKGFYRGKWVAISPQRKASDTEDTNLCSLVVNQLDQVLVGEIRHKYISKHTKDGCHISSFQVAITPYCIAVSSTNNIIVSDWSDKAPSVQVLSNTGNLLNIINPPLEINQSLPLCGLACYEDILCICSYHNKRIFCFSLSGKYLGSIGINIPSHPNGVTFTRDGRLLVTYGDSEMYPPAGIAVYKPLEIRNEEQSKCLAV